MGAGDKVSFKWDSRAVALFMHGLGVCIVCSTAGEEWCGVKTLIDT